jgi:hypothetical protein
VGGVAPGALAKTTSATAGLVHASFAPAVDVGRRTSYRAHGVELTLEVVAPPRDQPSSARTRSASQV